MKWLYWLIDRFIPRHKVINIKINKRNECVFLIETAWIGLPVKYIKLVMCTPKKVGTLELLKKHDLIFTNSDKNIYAHPYKTNTASYAMNDNTYNDLRLLFPLFLAKRKLNIVRDELTFNTSLLLNKHTNTIIYRLSKVIKNEPALLRDIVGIYHNEMLLSASIDICDNKFTAYETYTDGCVNIYTFDINKFILEEQTWVPSINNSFIRHSLTIDILLLGTLINFVTDNVAEVEDYFKRDNKLISKDKFTSTGYLHE